MIINVAELSEDNAHRKTSFIVNINVGEFSEVLRQYKPFIARRNIAYRENACRMMYGNHLHVAQYQVLWSDLRLAKHDKPASKDESLMRSPAVRI